MSVAFQPAMYYEVTARDDNPDCVNYEQTFTVPEFYSNDGVHCYVQCGRCGQHMEILTAALLDPQPEVS
ncbi:hypothetical protein ACFWIO_19020 [Streptomyces diastatochromogenes]|uniref:hypothetical protein n=1 Tax=Streptomyces diastatochromogenes TaxID=42236 RepID=UPI003655F79F